ncbi:BN159_2729 family protein [Streptomyces sp. NPDC054871]
MNKNLPHAVKVIRQALASSGSDPSAAIAHALNDARLLVDAEKSYGLVLHRTATGSWSREPQKLTPVDRQALAWEQATKRAQELAARIEAEFRHTQGFLNVQTENDGSVLVGVHVTDLGQWSWWRQYFGVTEDQVEALDYATVGRGRRDGVAVAVVAYDVPQVQARAEEVAARPFRLGGEVYDLALPQRDANGNVWFFHGHQTPEGMPLLSVDGRPERCSLANIVEFCSPLTAVRDAVTPVNSGGGEAA